jgi:hypothetical protein
VGNQRRAFFILQALFLAMLCLSLVPLDPKAWETLSAEDTELSDGSDPFGARQDTANRITSTLWKCVGVRTGPWLTISK